MSSFAFGDDSQRSNQHAYSCFIGVDLCPVWSWTLNLTETQSKVGRDFLHVSEEEAAQRLLKDEMCETKQSGRRNWKAGVAAQKGPRPKLSGPEGSGGP